MGVQGDVLTKRTEVDAQDELCWPLAGYYVSEKHKLVYCPIQKVACSSLKLWWAALEDESPAQFVSRNEIGLPNIDHPGLNARFMLRHQRRLAKRPLSDDCWLRVAFVRNPRSRLVSAFLNKFVCPEDLTQPVFQSVHSQWRIRILRSMRDAALWPLLGSTALESEPLQDSLRPLLSGKKAWHDVLTFRHFVEYLSGFNLDEHSANLHWRPQYRFLGDVSFHFVGHFEQLDDDVQAISELLGLQVQLPAMNRTRYMQTDLPTSCFADCPLKDLRQLPAMPDYRQFYTPVLRDRVARLYRRDIEQFGYDFDGIRPSP